jgi:L-glyceraldehyde 3-phosphate reductase
VSQLDDNLDALTRLGFSDEELAAIDGHAVDLGINIWAESSSY